MGLDPRRRALAQRLWSSGYAVYSGSNHGDPKCLKRFGRKFKDFPYLLAAESGVRSARGVYAFVFRVLALCLVLPSLLAHLGGAGCAIL